jgi:hypothetical protein
MLSRIIAAIALSLTLLLSGCATQKLPFSDDTDASLKTGKPIFLMTATLRNNYKPAFQPKLQHILVEKSGAQGIQKNMLIFLDAKAKDESNSPVDGSSYLLRMELEQGGYVIRGLNCQGQSFPIIASYFAPIHAELISSKTGVFYLGHIKATVRERKENEFKAGSSFPLLDQSLAGASGGTFDIEISDQWDKDGEKFLAKFPVLKSVTIQKNILPPFDRATAQKWWEAH